MTVIKFLGGALFAGCLANAVADDVVWPDQLELKNLSFPESELHRYLAANDAYAYIPGGFFASGIGMPSPGSFDVDLGGLAKSMTADCAIHTAADKTSASSAADMRPRYSDMRRNISACIRCLAANFGRDSRISGMRLGDLDTKSIWNRFGKTTGE